MRPGAFGFRAEGFRVFGFRVSGLENLAMSITGGTFRTEFVSWRSMMMIVPQHGLCDSTFVGRIF